MKTFLRGYTGMKGHEGQGDRCADSLCAIEQATKPDFIGFVAFLSVEGESAYLSPWLPLVLGN